MHLLAPRQLTYGRKGGTEGHSKGHIMKKTVGLGPRGRSRRQEARERVVIGTLRKGVRGSRPSVGRDWLNDGDYEDPMANMCRQCEHCIDTRYNAAA
jgi:hypothetical protein